jgi:predicted flap endonuclease-1-like 5' DNA nuclease
MFLLSITRYLFLLPILAQVEAANDGRTPLWVPALLVALMLLLFWWGLSRPSLTGRDEVAAAHGHVDDAHAPADTHHAHAITAEPVTADPPHAAPPMPDDLAIIEGIGPKIAAILRDAGITTFAQLAAADIEQLEQIVRQDAGLHIAFPDTWPEQARLAAAGDWMALETLQTALKGGRRQA